MMKEVIYDWGGANLWLFQIANNWRGAFVDRVMLLGTQISDHTLFPIYLTLIVLVAVFAAARVGETKPREGSQLAMSWLVTLSILCVAYLLDGALLTWAKHWFEFPRPLLALPQGSVQVIGEAEYRRSLPSGHASFAAVIAASLWPMLNRWQRWAAIVFVAWVCVSRVNVGAHFPADVLASLLTALPLVLLVRMIARRYVRSSRIGLVVANAHDNADRD